MGSSDEKVQVDSPKDGEGGSIRVLEDTDEEVPVEGSRERDELQRSKEGGNQHQTPGEQEGDIISPIPCL